MIRSYQDLEVWKKSLRLVKDVYGCTRLYPKSELYGLVSQTQRAAVSVPANIAEGRTRYSKKDFVSHLKIASGSLAELETHLFIATELGYITIEQRDALLNTSAEIGRMLNGLVNSLKSEKQLEPET